MRQIRDYYVASGAVLTGDVVLSAGVNIWFGCVVRGDLSRITLGRALTFRTAASSTPTTTS